MHHLSVILSLLLAIHLHSTSALAGGRSSLVFCTNNETITLQIATRHEDSRVSCKCESAAAGDPGRPGYVHKAGLGSYKLHTDAKAWNEARKTCHDEGGHLAIINSRAEEAVLVDMLKRAEKSIKYALNTEEALIGIHDLYKEGEWVTILGESLFATGYSNWSPTYFGGQPDNYGGNQNCGALLNFHGMDDVFCHDKFAFFCELPLAC